jgi:dTDP-4-amino-4,6-dideoxygalactose transaminase
MIPLFKVFMNPAVTEIVNPTLVSGFISQGARVEEFETKLRSLFDHPYLVTLNSATSGLTLALRMIKDKYHLQETDEVLSSPLTCMATNEPILANNLRIKWVDVDSKTCNIDLNDLEKKISKTTRILLFVHWGGNPLNMDKLTEVLDKKEKEFGFRVQVIEDCAHAMLAEWNGRKLGTTGNYAVYSLQAIKHLTTGDGGVLLLPTEGDMEEAKLLRWFGIDREKRNFKGKDFRLEGDVERWGYKFHMNDINASIGLANIQSVNDIVKKHRDNSLYYDKQLQNLPGIHLLEKSENGNTASWIYTLLVDRLEEFIEYMKEKNITVSSVHKRNDVHTCFKQFKTDLPQLDQLESKYVCIPVGWWLTEMDRNHIVEIIKEFSVL